MHQAPFTLDGDQRTCGSEHIPDPDIVELNLAWLMKARELAKSEPAKAIVLFGLDPGLLEVLCNASIENLRHLAQSGLMMFRPRFHIRFWRQRSETPERSSVGLALQSVLMAAEEIAGR
ncbi:MAG: flagellar transcriptional regulator FlhD [Pseudomonadota bacterium]|nr:flagellar transcriptional regulator FlhD [Pseudomonadota bacterium]